MKQTQLNIWDQKTIHCHLFIEEKYSTLHIGVAKDYGMIGLAISLKVTLQ